MYFNLRTFKIAQGIVAVVLHTRNSFRLAHIHALSVGLHFGLSSEISSLLS